MTDYLPVGCYGKAPCWREYLEHEVVHPVSRRLKRWLHQGFDEARLTHDGGDSGFEEAATLRFLVAPEEGNEWLAGVVGPSADTGGRRKFLAVFAHLAKRRYQKSYHLLPIALTPTWRSLDATRSQLMEAVSRESFEDLLHANRVPWPTAAAELEPDYQRHLGEAAAGIDPAALGPAIREVRDRVKATRNEPFVVTLPVSDDLELAAYDAAFWIDLVNRQFFMKSYRPSIFLAPRGERNDLFLVYGELQTPIYEALMGAAPGAAVERPLAISAGDVPGPSYSSLLKVKA